jgi:hypothetical protein
MLVGVTSTNAHEPGYIESPKEIELNWFALELLPCRERPPGKALPCTSLQDPVYRKIGRSRRIRSTGEGKRWLVEAGGVELNGGIECRDVIDSPEPSLLTFAIVPIAVHAPSENYPDAGGASGSSLRSICGDCSIYVGQRADGQRYGEHYAIHHAKAQALGCSRFPTDPNVRRVNCTEGLGSVDVLDDESERSRDGQRASPGT